MKIKVVLSIGGMDSAFETLKQGLQQYADVVVVGLDDYDLCGADIFIGKKLDADKLSNADKLKAVFAYKTGVEDFPLAQLAARGIILCNSHADSDYIAQYAFALALSLVSRVTEFDRKLRHGDWCLDNPHWESIFDKKVGLVGYGAIGRQIAKILVANGISVYTLNRGKDYTGVTVVDSLPQLCQVCDILMLSLPATNQTDKMFNTEILQLLRGKYLVNVGRNNCIDEQALYLALSKGQLKGAALDAWHEKPQTIGQTMLPFSQPFDKLDNVILSSHKAMQVSDGHRRYVLDVLDNVTKYILMGSVTNAVDLSKGY